jgi:hypothetical protein
MATPSKNPNAHELKYNEHKEKPIESEEKKPIDETVESAEDRMAKYYEEKEAKAAEAYQKAFYGKSPPLSEEDIKRRKNFWRINGKYLR